MKRFAEGVGAAVLAVGGASLAAACSCHVDPAGSRPVVEDCQAGPLCDRTVDLGTHTGIVQIQGILENDDIIAIGVDETTGPGSAKKTLWRIGEDRSEMIADNILPLSVWIDARTGDVFYGADPDRIPTNMIDAGYVPVDLHVWRDGEERLLVANVLAGYQEVCSTGEYIWIWKQLGNWLNCGILGLVELRAEGPVPLARDLDEICVAWDDQVPATFTADCRHVVAANPWVRNWTVDEAGTALRFDDGSDRYEFASDGRHVALVPDDGTSDCLRIMDTQDGDSVFERCPVNGEFLGFDPDGLRALYQTERWGSDNHRYEVLELGATQPMVFEFEKYASKYQTLFSPDGRRLAISGEGNSESELILADLRDGGVRRLAKGVAASMDGAWRKNFERRPEMQFSEDGKYLTYFVESWAAGASGEGFEVRVLDLATHSTRVLGRNVGHSQTIDFPMGGGGPHACFSPDGSHVAWKSVDGELFVARVESEAGRRVTAGPIEDFALSKRTLGWISADGGLRLAGLDP